MSPEAIVDTHLIITKDLWSRLRGKNFDVEFIYRHWAVMVLCKKLLDRVALVSQKANIAFAL